MNKTISLLLILFISGCASNKELKNNSAVSEDKSLQVVLANGSHTLTSSQQLHPIDMETSRIHFSTFETAPENVELFIQRRHDLFKQNFKDDVDPYTGKVNKRSRCWISSQSHQVLFKSGPEVQWSDCAYSTSPRFGVRTWIYCPAQKTLWELTFVSAKKTALPQLACN